MSPQVELLIVLTGVAVAAYILAARTWQVLRGSKCGGGCAKCAAGSSEPTNLVQLDSAQPKRPQA